MRRVAVIGSGIAGLAAAHGLAGRARVTLFEAADYFGGHTHTVDVTLDGVTHGVDTGFLVFNQRTYPNLVRLFDQLGVAVAPSKMSFSARLPGLGMEWSSACKFRGLGGTGNCFHRRGTGGTAVSASRRAQLPRQPRMQVRVPGEDAAGSERAQDTK